MPPGQLPRNEACSGGQARVEAAISLAKWAPEKYFHIPDFYSCLLDFDS
jgi:hypothetical protein